MQLHFVPLGIAFIALFTARSALAEPPATAEPPRDVVPAARFADSPVPPVQHSSANDCSGCEAAYAPRGANASAANARKHEEHTVWYGWQTLLADGAGIGVFAAGGPLAFVGVGEYLVAAPIIHLAHDRPGAAGESFLLRLGLAGGGALVGALAGSGGDCGSSDIPCSAIGGIFGLVLGGASAIIIDAAALAHETAPTEPRVERGLSVLPTVGVTRHSGTVGLAGIF